MIKGYLEIVKMMIHWSTIWIKYIHVSVDVFQLFKFVTTKIVE